MGWEFPWHRAQPLDREVLAQLEGGTVLPMFSVAVGTREKVEGQLGEALTSVNTSQSPTCHNCPVLVRDP